MLFQRIVSVEPACLEGVVFPSIYPTTASNAACDSFHGEHDVPNITSIQRSSRAVMHAAIKSMQHKLPGCSCPLVVHCFAAALALTRC